MSIFAELKRRSVFRVALVYMAGAWLILQIGDVVFPVLDVPAWSMRLLLGLLGLGLPIAILLAWTFDITPQGIRRDAGGEATAAPAKKNVRRLDFAIIGLLSLAVVFLLLNRGDGGDNQRIAGVSAIAVLPLQLLNAESDKEYLADGMTMSLINELSKIEALRVISRTSVQKFRNSQLSLPEIAAALNVDVIIEGTVLSSGNQIRISANLVPADSDSPVWSEIYDDDLGDVLAMQTKIARAVARQVSITLTDADEARLVAQPAVDAKVLDLIFKGRHLVTTTHGREGREMLEAATILAPDYAPAWIALGYAYRSWSNDDPADLVRAKEALEKAMQLDANNDNAHYLAGSIALYNDWDWPLAIASLNRALELNPGHEWALQALGDYYEMLGQYPRSIELGLRSVESNPASSGMYMNLGLTYEYAGMNQEALEACEMAAALSPESAWAAICLAEVHAAMGNSAEAAEMASKAVNDYLSEDLVLGLAAIAYAKAGEQGKAEEVRAHLVRQSELRFVSPMALSYGAFATNELESFFHLMQQVIDLKIPFSPWVATVPHFAEARKDPRMQPILESLNLPIH